ncbi:hypothetical protein [Gudongella sp. DL1XJH-153]|uniref:hypothetical protein n=1 Tax=Gudongella sp. DL1XJH-153 TaxID=3409804 RepID=UPI003BB5DE23
MASLGLGSVGTAYFANLTKYKPIFVIITGILLYITYSRIEKKNAGKTTRIIFWVSAALAILALYYPTILGFFYAS